MILLTRIIPRKAGLALCGAIGTMAFAVPHADRRRTLAHLRMIYGTRWNERKIATVARGVYRELGKNFYDALLLRRLRPEQLDRIVHHDSLEAVRQAYAPGRGCIMITAHTGCFEMLLHLFPHYGFKAFAIGKKLHDEGLDAIISNERRDNDTVYMDRSESTVKIVRLLREGRIFGVLIDQDTSVEGVFADFLGRPAYTPSGPVKMAMKLDIPLFVVTTARQPDQSHHIFVDGPVMLDRGGDFDRDLICNVTKVNALIGRTIEMFPEQWVWMHRRWRRRPPGENGRHRKERE